MWKNLVNEDKLNILVQRWLTPTSLAALIAVGLYSVRALERVEVTQQALLVTQQQIIDRIERNEELIFENQE